MTALYVLGALLVVLLAGVVLAPLVEREPPDEEIDELPPEERRDAAVEALSEVEFEYRTDKLSEDEYRRLRAHYGRIALDAEDAMEAAPPAETAGPGSCGECGREVPPGARFCPACGARQVDRREEAE